jgi:transcriptional accessory protein Tex/SPT6
MYATIEPGLSELSNDKVDNPEDMVKVGDEPEVKVPRVDTEERKIGLSRCRIEAVARQHTDLVLYTGAGKNVADCPVSNCFNSIDLGTGEDQCTII